MHLIVLENQPSSSRGGQELNLLEICRGLSQRGHSITLIYLREGDLIEQYRRFCNHIIKVKGYGFDRRRIIDIFGFLPKLLYMWNIPVSQDSIVFSNDYYSAFFGYILAFLKNCPFVCYFQIPPYDLNQQRLMGLKGARHFIAVSNQTKLDWTKLGFAQEKISVVHNGTNIEKFQPLEDLLILKEKWQIPEHSKVISYVGRLDKPKGIETLIKAFALLQKTGINAKLLIAGKPLVHPSPQDGRESSEEGEKYKQSLEELAKDLGIDKSVDFLGHITNTPALYQVSDVTVVPSLWPEPFGRVIVESMACGIPVVASRVGGIPEILTGEFANGLFEPGNEQDLATILNQTIYWRDNKPEFGTKCRQHIVNNFSLEKMIDSIEKVFLQVIKP